MKEKVRDRIIRVASDLFYKQGFNSTGINQIIAEADIAIGSLYNHFASKNDLLLVYLKEEEKKWFKGYEDFTSNCKTDYQKLIALFDYRAHLQKKSDFAGCHFVKITAELGKRIRPVTKFVANHKRKQKELILHLVTNIPNSSKLSPKKLAYTVFLLLEGAVNMATINNNVTPINEAKKTVKSLLS